MSEYRPGYIEGKRKLGVYVAEEVHKALRLRAAETGESMGQIAERALRKELGMMAGARYRVAAEKDGHQVILARTDFPDLADIIAQHLALTLREYPEVIVQELLRGRGAWRTVAAWSAIGIGPEVDGGRCDEHVCGRH